jgi:hypothetical protein
MARCAAFVVLVAAAALLAPAAQAKDIIIGGAQGWTNSALPLRAVLCCAVLLCAALRIGLACLLRRIARIRRGSLLLHVH